METVSVVTRDQALAWSRVLVPWWWPRVVLPVAWVLVMFVVLIGLPPMPQCYNDTDVCTDTGVPGGILAGLFLFAPLLLAVAPSLGLVAGGAGAFAWVVLGPQEVATAGILTSYGLACLVTLVLVLLDRFSPRRRRADTDTTISPDLAASLQPPWTLWAGPAVVASAALLLACGYAYYYAQEVRLQAERVARGVVETGTVSALDEWTNVMTVELPVAGPVEVEAWAFYAVGDQVDILLDPERQAWVQLVDEPPYNSLVLAPVGALLLVAGLMVGRLLRLAFFLGDLQAGRLPQHRVLFGLRAKDAYFHGFPADGNAFAALPVSTSVTGLNGGPAPQTSLVDGFFVGDLAPGGLGIVVAGNEVRWPRRGLRDVRHAPGSPPGPTLSLHTKPWN